MGYSWSMYWCQCAHENCLDVVAAFDPSVLAACSASARHAADLGPEHRLRERHPFPGWERGQGSKKPPGSSSANVSVERGQVDVSDPGPHAALGCVNLVSLTIPQFLVFRMRMS